MGKNAWAQLLAGSHRGNAVVVPLSPAQDASLSLAQMPAVHAFCPSSSLVLLLLPWPVTCPFGRIHLAFA